MDRTWRCPECGTWVAETDPSHPTYGSVCPECSGAFDEPDLVTNVSAENITHVLICEMCEAITRRVVPETDEEFVHRATEKGWSLVNGLVCCPRCKDDWERGMRESFDF